MDFGIEIEQADGGWRQWQPKKALATLKTKVRNARCSPSKRMLTLASISDVNSIMHIPIPLGYTA